MDVNSTMIAAVDTIRYVDTFIHPVVGKLSDKYPVMPASNFSNMTIHVSSYLDAKFGSDITKVILGYANYKQTDMYIGVFCPNSKVQLVVFFLQPLLKSIQPVLEQKKMNYLCV